MTGAQELPSRRGGRGKSGELDLDVVNGGVVGLGDLGSQKVKVGVGSLKGKGKGKGGDARLDRFTSRRTSQRLESDDCSVASVRGR